METVARAGFAGVQIVAARLEAAPDALASLAACLSEGERARAARYRLGRDRRRYIVARALLRRLLGERLGEPPAALQLGRGARGKPALTGRQARSGWRFNVSHCEDLALFAFSREGALGVDVEAVRAFADAEAIARRFFSPAEAQAYLALAPQERALGFFQCWTRKEAVIKALGEGLYLPLDSFEVSLAPGAPAAVLRMAQAEGDGGWRLHSFSPLPGFIAAAALRRG